MANTVSKPDSIVIGPKVAWDVLARGVDAAYPTWPLSRKAGGDRLIRSILDTLNAEGYDIVRRIV